MPHRLTVLLTCISFGFTVACGLPATAAASLVNKATLPDSTIEQAALLAARGDANRLRPLFATLGDSLPPDVQLYCVLALSRADHRWERVVACVDSLIGHYSDRIDIRGHLSLSLLKAETLRRMGDYTGLAAYCKAQINYYRGRNVRAILLDPFRALERKGRRLSATDERTQALRLADRDLAFDLAARFGNRLDAFDRFARLRCRLTLAAAFNRPAELAAVADSLLTICTDSLDNDEKTHCLQALGHGLMINGDWGILGKSCQRLAHRWRNSPELLDHYKRLAATFRTYAPSSVDTLAADAIIAITTRQAPVVAISIGDQTAVPFTLDTGVSHTLLTADDAKQAGLTVVDDTIEVVSGAGLVKACPAMAPCLRMGSVCLRNVLVYVVADGNKQSASSIRTIGLTELARLGTIDLCKDQLIVRNTTTLPHTTVSPNLRMSPLNELILDAKLNNKPVRFICSTAYPTSFLTPEAIRAKACGDTVTTLSIGMVSLPIKPQIGELQDTGLDGMLGTPFFLTADHVRIDFTQMALSYSSVQTKNTISNQSELGTD